MSKPPTHLKSKREGRSRLSSHGRNVVTEIIPCSKFLGFAGWRITLLGYGCHVSINHQIRSHPSFLFEFRGWRLECLFHKQSFSFLTNSQSHDLRLDLIRITHL